MKLSLTLVICVFGIAAQVAAGKPKHGTTPAPNHEFCQFQKKDCKNFKCEPSKVPKCVHNPVEDFVPFCACVPEGCVADDKTNVINDEGCDKYCKKQDQSQIGSCNTEPESYSIASPKCVCKKGCKQDESVGCGNFECEASYEVSCIYRATVNPNTYCGCIPKGCFLNYGESNQRDLKDQTACTEYCKQKNGNDYYGQCIRIRDRTLYDSNQPEECHCEDGSSVEIEERKG